MRSTIIAFLFIAFLCILSCTKVSAQSSYSGFIDKYPIKLVLPQYLEDDITAVYVYTKFDDPITITGKKAGDTLTLYEKDTAGKNTACLSFTGFSIKYKTLTGTFKNLLTNKQLFITLHKDFDIEEGEDIEWENRELIQPFVMRGQYFTLITSKEKGDYYAHVSGINIYQQKTDCLIQHLTVDCQLQSYNSLEAGDFNFDGYKDFSIFEYHHAGPNITSLYFLFDPKTKMYFESGFKGVSLQFDEHSKTIAEHNQCCGGRQHTTAIYKVVKNKMVLLEQHCYIYDERKQDLIEHKMKDCE